MDEYYMMEPCPANTTQYAIKAGDTYYSIARRYGTTVEALVAANPGVNPNMLTIGKLICVPRRNTYPACEGGTYYTIRAGDTFYAIAVKFNLSLSALTAANPGTDPARLYVGQAICIPASAATPICAGGSTPYVVQAGDTLYGIAARYGIELDALMRRNPGVNPRSLHVGQVLCLPIA